MSGITYEKRGRIAYITINRPEAMNGNYIRFYPLSLNSSSCQSSSSRGALAPLQHSQTCPESC